MAALIKKRGEAKNAKGQHLAGKDESSYSAGRVLGSYTIHMISDMPSSESMWKGCLHPRQSVCVHSVHWEGIKVSLMERYV